MKKHSPLLLIMPLFAAQSPLSAVTASLSDIADRLDNLRDYAGKIKYDVLLPMAANDVEYTLNLFSTATPDDRLSPCDYLIDWTLTTSENPSQGFSAYSDGHHYRYRDQRLQEYHFEADSLPFLSGRTAVQRSAQFADLTPQNVADQIRNIATDSAYTYKLYADTLVNGKRADVVKAVESQKGYVSRELTYIFDAATGLPQKFEFENNPGSISEQTVTVTFSYPENLAFVNDYSEPALIDRYPDVFSQYRQSNFRVENLPGTRLPAFSLPTLSQDRYIHNRDEKFRSPLVLVVLDPSVGSVTETIENVRKATSRLPFNADILWVFSTNHVETVAELVGEGNRVGETTLLSARSLLRDLGVTVTPTLIFVDTDATIRDTQIGQAENLPEIITRKFSFAF